MRLGNITDWRERARAAKYNPTTLAKDRGNTSRPLRRIARTNSGCSARRWLDNLRLQQALKLLGGTKNVKEVAQELDYKQASHFSRQFKQFCGKPPGQFKSVGSS